MENEGEVKEEQWWGLKAWKILKTVRQRSPLIQCITNFVSMDLMANTLLAAGASPAMLHCLQEIPDFTPQVDALCINLGNLSPDWLPSMKSAAVFATNFGKPWVLEPVAASASDFRLKTCLDLINLKPTVIRGNASEILALANASRGTHNKGWDSSHGSMDAVEAVEAAAKSLSISSGAVVVVSGAVSIVTDGKRSVGASNGVPMMQQITATGCAVTALIAAFVAIDPLHAFEATASALSIFGVAGEMGMDMAKGPASLRMHLIDSLHGLDQTTVLSRVKINSVRITLEAAKEVATPKVSWLPPEEEALCHAFVSVSEDGTVGVGQPRKTFWDRVHESFVLHYGNPEGRNAHSLNNHFILIKKPVASFVSILRGLYQKPRSRWSQMDIVKNAHMKFISRNGKAFIYDHCLMILRKMSKYNPLYNPEVGANVEDAPLTTPTTTFRLFSPLRADDDPRIDRLTPEGGACSSRDRPLGYKAQKKAKLSGAASSSREASIVVNTEFVELYKQSIEKRELNVKVSNDSMTASAASMDRVREHNRLYKEWEQDDQVMAMRLDCMPDHQRFFFEQRQHEIAVKRGWKPPPRNRY